MTSRVPSTLPPGSEVTYPILTTLRRRGLPMTRANYLKLDYPDGVPTPWTVELEMELPPALRDMSLRIPPGVDRRPAAED